MELISFKITTDSDLLKEEHHITPYISDLLTKLYEDIPKQKKSTLDKLLKYVVQFPKVPNFKNYLASYYQISGNYKKTREVNEWILKEHPHYLFGIVGEANSLIEDKKYDEVKNMLGENLLLNELYPDRDEFHLDEVMVYFSTTIRYLYAIGDEEQAETRLEILEEIDNDHRHYESALNFKMQFLLKKNLELFERESQLRKEVPLLDRLSSIQTTIPPKFYYPTEIQYLYENDCIEILGFLDKFLQLDPEFLIEDLILVLKDAMFRHEYYLELEIQNISEDKNLSFPIHALLLLSYFKNPKALPILFEILRQDSEFIDFWFGDTLTNLMEETLCFIGDNHISSFISFLKEPNVYAYCKSLVSDSMAKILFQKNTVKRDVSLKYCEDILDFFIQNKENENIADTEFLGLFISDLISFNAKELLPKIKTVFDLELVGFWICGDYKSVEEDMIKTQDIEILEPYSSIKEPFEKHIAYWYDKPTHLTPQNNFNQDVFTEISPTIKSEFKIGRNEPCPCGSGKKYKKCCLNN